MFSTESGFRWGDSLPPTHFANFFNDLTKEFKELDMGIPFDKDKICILHFADDIVLLEENESQLQKLFDFVNT